MKMHLHLLARQLIPQDLVGIPLPTHSSPLSLSDFDLTIPVADNASLSRHHSAHSPDLKSEPSNSKRLVNNEPDVEDTPMVDAEASATASSSDQLPTRDRDNGRLQTLIENGSPEALEAEIKISQAFLASLKAPLSETVGEHKASQYFTQQIETLQNQNVDTPTIIGVVGNTGAGKSSVINALLDEERLVTRYFPCSGNIR
jgi:ABC-type multidrug transport system fused ATPase/permease subunit